jgi:hypothetical protein
MFMAFESLAGGFPPVNIQEKQKPGKWVRPAIASAISSPAEKPGAYAQHLGARRRKMKRDVASETAWRLAIRSTIRPIAAMSAR